MSKEGASRICEAILQANGGVDVAAVRHTRVFPDTFMASSAVAGLEPLCVWGRRT
jgi:hypothetical protein